MDSQARSQLSIQEIMLILHIRNIRRIFGFEDEEPQSTHQNFRITDISIKLNLLGFSDIPNGWFVSVDPNFSKVMRPQKALAQHWSNLSVQTSRYHLVLLALIQKRRIGVEIYISNDKAFGKAVFTHQVELEHLLGVKGEPYDAEKSCGIRFYHEDATSKESAICGAISLTGNFVPLSSCVKPS